jgi:hypothetical protein
VQLVLTHQRWRHLRVFAEGSTLQGAAAAAMAAAVLLARAPVQTASRLPPAGFRAAAGASPFTAAAGSATAAVSVSACR